MEEVVELSDVAPVQIQDATDQVYRRLRRLILQLELPPGTRLSVRALADQLGVSSTPVKAAFDRLSGERLLRIEPRKGTFVALSPESLNELFGVRIALELYAAEEGCRIATPEQIEGLRSALEAINEATAPKQFDSESFRFNVSQKDYDFHRTMVAMLGNRELLAQYESLELGILMHRRRAISSRGDEVLQTGEHQEIFDAYVRQDVETLRRVLREHLRESVTLTTYLLNEGNVPPGRPNQRKASGS